jgi:protein SCO1/2
MKNSRTIGSILMAGLAALTMAACSGDQPKSEATSDTAMTETAPAETRTYTSHGVITKIDSAENMITLNHQNIGDYMEAMTMPFKVSDPAMLGQANVGDSVEFTLSVTGEQAMITQIQKSASGAH